MGFECAYGDILTRSNPVLKHFMELIHYAKTTAWKVSKYGVISDPYFPVFSPNTGQYGPEITPYLDTFHAITVSTFCSSLPSLSCVSGTNAVSSATESAT